jgi:O-antigen/teichoic acid export membrane protein
VSRRFALLTASLAGLVDPSDDDRLTRRVPLPEGTIPVGIGLLIAGIASFAFFRVGTDALGGESQFKPLQNLWFATFALAPGFFLPLEQELGRALSHRRAQGAGGRPVAAKVVRLGILLAGMVMVAIALASPVITSSYFDGDWVMLVALMLAFVAYMPAHLSRGVTSGNGRFRAYAVVLGADGVMRIVLCILLAAIGISTAGPYGFAVAISPLFGVAWVAWRRELRTSPGPEASWQEVTPNLGWLLLGSVFAAALVNAGPVAANLLATPDQDALVTAFGKGVLLARIPLFLFQAVQAALLPRLSRLAARNELDEFRNGFRRLMVIVAAVGIIGTLGAYVLGPFIVSKMYEVDLSRRTMAMLALGSALYMVALALAQAVIALSGHALVAVGWTVGMVSFVVVTWLAGTDLFKRVELGLVLSSLAALIAFAFALRSRLQVGVAPTADSMFEAMTDMPLET